MADRIAPTQRNKLLGLLADSLSGVYDYAQRPDPTMPMGFANPVLGLLADALPLKAGANVLDDLSYGQAPIRGTGMTTRLTPDATELAMAAAPFPKTSGKAALAALGAVDTGVGKAMFIGPTAKTWDKAAAATAQKMEKAGADPRAIWSETGTFKGPDGKWRQEISDDAARVAAGYGPPSAADVALSRTGRKVFELPPAQADAIRSEARAQSDRFWKLPFERQVDETWPLYDKVSHSQLRAAYPDTESIRTAGMVGHQVGGSYDETTDLLRYGGGPQVGGFTDQDKSIALHELQHAIQQREGFAPGGSPELFTQQAEAEKARDLLNWRREVDAKLTSTSAKSWDEAEKAVINDYKSVGAPDWIPNEQVRKMARSPQDYFESPPEEFVKLYGLDRRSTPYSAQEAYRRLAGEAEARATQARMNMTPDQRRATFPYDSYDVPVNQLIVRSLLD